MKFRNSITIEKKEDWEDVAAEIIDEFLEDFRIREGLTREPDNEDLDDFDGSIGFMYTQKGMALYDRMRNRLNTIGNKLFPGEEFNYNCSNMIFP